MEIPASLFGIPIYLAFLIVTVLLLFTLAILRYILQRRAEARLQLEVRNLLFEYIPVDGFEMENISSIQTLNESLL